MIFTLNGCLDCHAGYECGSFALDRKYDTFDKFMCGCAKNDTLRVQLATAVRVKKHFDSGTVMWII